MGFFLPFIASLFAGLLTSGVSSALAKKPEIDPLPTPQEPDIAGIKNERRRRAAGGFFSTILTSGQGVQPNDKLGQ